MQIYSENQKSINVHLSIMVHVLVPPGKFIIRTNNNQYIFYGLIRKGGKTSVPIFSYNSLNSKAFDKSRIIMFKTCDKLDQTFVRNHRLYHGKEVSLILFFQVINFSFQRNLYVMS